nr:immunoglobulin light chain junction region [Macaca mulatta]MOX09517.1 immunoglobulin light chain junction region [Macaca mulatta]
CLQFNSNPRTF